MQLLDASAAAAGDDAFSTLYPMLLTKRANFFLQQRNYKFYNQINNILLTRTLLMAIFITFSASFISKGLAIDSVLASYEIK